ncbi:hypothetical protein G7Y89_g4472 [Cudoniella acicularis]|uniref:Uncharacterized protein n=1 Tax=Cudoniella acicularis TaxID=354080 RepID=A0A8H4W493_9HELO|nr:hypothetical protein G7Y89_g4472 [Cudoniella acicularis]
MALTRGVPKRGENLDPELGNMSNTPNEPPPAYQNAIANPPPTYQRPGASHPRTHNDRGIPMVDPFKQQRLAQPGRRVQVINGPDRRQQNREAMRLLLFVVVFTVTIAIVVSVWHGLPLYNTPEVPESSTAPPPLYASPSHPHMVPPSYSHNGATTIKPMGIVVPPRSRTNNAWKSYVGKTFEVEPTSLQNLWMKMPRGSADISGLETNQDPICGCFGVLEIMQDTPSAAELSENFCGKSSAVVRSIFRFVKLSLVLAAEHTYIQLQKWGMIHGNRTARILWLPRSTLIPMSSIWNRRITLLIGIPIHGPSRACYCLRNTPDPLSWESSSCYGEEVCIKVGKVSDSSHLIILILISLLSSHLPILGFKHLTPASIILSSFYIPPPILPSKPPITSSVMARFSKLTVALSLFFSLTSAAPLPIPNPEALTLAGRSADPKAVVTGSVHFSDLPANEKRKAEASPEGIDFASGFGLTEDKRDPEGIHFSSGLGLTEDKRDPEGIHFASGLGLTEDKRDEESDDEDALEELEGLEARTPSGIHLLLRHRPHPR